MLGMFTTVSMSPGGDSAQPLSDAKAEQVPNRFLRLAERLGYAAATSFVSAFKRCRGRTPRSLRSENAWTVLKTPRDGARRSDPSVR